MYYLCTLERAAKEFSGFEAPIVDKDLRKCTSKYVYSEVPNRQADWNKQAGLEKSVTLLAYLQSKLINEQGGVFRFLHEKL